MVNPIGSQDPADFKVNVGNLDKAMNDQASQSWTDRFGVDRLTWFGIETKTNEAINGLAFKIPVDYAAGLNVNTKGFTITYSGVVYAPQPSAVPFTTGEWDAAQWYPIQNLFNQNNILVFDDYASASAAAATLPDGQQLDVEDDLKRYTVLLGGLQFVRNLEELRYDLEENTGAGLVGFDRTLQFNQGTVGSAVKEAVGALTFVERFRATGMTDTQVLEAAVAYAEAKTEITTWPYKATTLWLENRVYEIDRPLRMTKALRFDGDRAEIRPSTDFAPITLTTPYGTEQCYALLVFLNGTKGVINEVVQWSASVGRGIVLNCNEVAKPGIYIERMPYSSINCEIQGSPDHGLEVGPYCWGINLDEITIENFTNDAVHFLKDSACNGVSISNPKIWGEFKTGRSGFWFVEDSEANGLTVSGGFVEKVLYGAVTEPGGIGQITFVGTDFEQCQYQVVRAVGGTKRKPQIKLESCFLHAIEASKVYASDAHITVENCRTFGAAADFETAGSGFIRSINNEFPGGLVNIATGSNVAMDADESGGRTVRNYAPRKKSSEQYPYQLVNYAFVDAPYLESSSLIFRHTYAGGTYLQYVGESLWYTSEYLHNGAKRTAIGVALGSPTSERTFRPMTDGLMSCGVATARWTQVYAYNGTINTSDGREKSAPVAIDDAALDAWGDVQLVTFQWLASIQDKGTDGARWHFGVIAQQVRDAFAAHGIDGTRYGLLCYDEWDAKDAVLSDSGAVIEPAREAGNRWGIRADQCLFLEAAYQRRRSDRIEAKLATIEAKL